MSKKDLPRIYTDCNSLADIHSRGRREHREEKIFLLTPLRPHLYLFIRG
jgi:hypothetical protein